MTAAEDRFDALTLTAVVALAVVGFVASVDLFSDGKLEASILALLVAAITPIIPAFIVRQSKNDRDERDRDRARDRDRDREP